MRLKQLLGIVLLASVSAMAAETVSQPGDVQVKSQDSAAAPKAGAATRIGKVSVARESDGLNIEISGSGPMTARTMKLTHPDRVVVVRTERASGRVLARCFAFRDRVQRRSAPLLDNQPTNEVVCSMGAT